MSVQVAIDERVRELVEAHRSQLIELVDQALAREIETLVAERLAATNGAHVSDAREDVVPTRESSSRGSATKVCTSCGQDKPAAAFDKYRRACKDCRRTEMRERAQARANGAPAARERGADTSPREIQPADAEEPPRTELSTPGEDRVPGP